MWDSQQKFRIRFGPMKLAQYERLLPGGPSQKRLAAWIANYLGREFLWEVQLVLLDSEVPTVRLGRVGRVGWSTWLRSGPLNRNPEDLILQPHLN
jgi:type VI secretion system protein ImpH